MTQQFTPVAFLLFITTTHSAAASAAATATATANSNSWFREKYLKQVYDDYYMYYRWKPNANDRDKCPEIHKPAVYFAMTGQQLWPKTPLTFRQQRELNNYRNRNRNRNQPNRYSRREYKAHYIHIINITIAEVIHFLLDFAQYCCEILILLLCIIMITLTILILYMLAFHDD